MGGSPRPSQRQTLAELVSSLQPGKDCPWCGGALQEGDLSEASEGERLGGCGFTSDRPTLRCARCGSEVCAVPGPDAPCRQSALGEAA